MTDTINKVREHYSAFGLTDRIRAAFTTITARKSGTDRRSTRSTRSVPHAEAKVA